MPAERLLVNFFYANPVGHAVEALHYCLGHHAADPTREVSVVLNAGTAVELAGFCPFVSHALAIDHPLLEPCPDSSARQAALPQRWDWVLDDFRRRQDYQLELFPGLRDYYETSDRLLTARPHGRHVGRLVAAHPRRPRRRVSRDRDRAHRQTQARPPHVHVAVPRGARPAPGASHPPARLLRRAALRTARRG